MKLERLSVLTTVVGLALGAPALASSHAEAPFVKEMPKIDSTDFYMFNSYEPGREDFVTIVANYYPLQDAYGGPNYFTLDTDALYQIHIDNNGDAVEDLTFSFRFTVTNRDIALNIGGKMIPIALVNAGVTGPSPAMNGALNVVETFGMQLIRGDRYTGSAQNLVDLATGSTSFRKPVDNIGEASIPNYETYARGHIASFAMPGSARPGRVFVGQRKDPFVVNLGEVFDLVNTNPLGPENAETDDLSDKNITSIIIEVPKSALVASSGDPVIGAWTSASLPRARVLTTNPTFSKPASEQGSFVQVSRLSMPLVNELVVGLRDKNKFNASPPVQDPQFLDYVTHPSFPAILELLFGVTPPCLPRNDLVQVFLTGVPGLNQPAMLRAPGEMTRLNTSIPARPPSMQHRLGVLGGDISGFPNGRRPGDDVVDIALRVVMGALYPDAGMPGGCAPFGNLPFTDGAFLDASFTDPAFPYLLSPIPGNRR